MSVLLRADDQAHFRDAIADTIAPFGVRVDANAGLRARILTGDVGAVHVTKVSGPPCVATRTAKLIRAADPELCKIDVQVRGRAVLAQDDREAALSPGDFSLLDLSRPCGLADRGDEHGIVAVAFPRALLPLPAKELSRLTAVRIPGDRGTRRFALEGGSCSSPTTGAARSIPAMTVRSAPSTRCSRT